MTVRTKWVAVLRGDTLELYKSKSDKEPAQRLAVCGAEVTGGNTTDSSGGTSYIIRMSQATGSAAGRETLFYTDSKKDSDMWIKVRILSELFR